MLRLKKILAQKQFNNQPCFAPFNLMRALRICAHFGRNSREQHTKAEFFTLQSVIHQTLLVFQLLFGI